LKTLIGLHMHTAPQQAFQPSDNESLLQSYLRIRWASESLVRALDAEDLVVQSMPDTSPAKWHLAHTTWFFETFVLRTQEGFRPFDPAYGYLFNSYYEALGPRQPRPQRGMLTRPSLKNIHAYRRHVDHQMQELLLQELDAAQRSLVELGLAHEEQHQELMQMDLLHLFSLSPLYPVASEAWQEAIPDARAKFFTIPGGVSLIGARDDGFAFDNERPRHRVLLPGFEIADRLVTNGEWMAFMADGGYRTPSLWLADGWGHVQQQQWRAPLYWLQDQAGWQQMTLSGLHPINPDAPVRHVSYYEAAAYALWSGARLPTEAEWEAAANAGILEQVDNVAWQWTQSAYSPYPGFRAERTAVGEYNGKFMVNQMVLRGGASVTPREHTRTTYRNFYRPEQRWMFSGVRLARELAGNDTRHWPAEFASDVRNGLSAKPKQISPKYFYDAAGSELFEAICRTAEYYPARTESGLLGEIASALAESIPANAALIEFGSGASDKTRLLLDAAPQLSAYVPIDISADALAHAVERLHARYPAIQVLPLEADFTAALALPVAVHDMPKVGFFPGSTIGNFTPEEAVRFLRGARRLLGEGATLIIGADVVKDEATLLAAYDDAEGITARFNQNLLVRINRELNGDFDLAQFAHQARWNAPAQRIEMHLVSRIDQIVSAAGQSFAFKAGESLHTENSHKFTPASFAALAWRAGWRVTQQWISNTPQFAIFCLTQGEQA
jgi:dimethylhistidine N-methyltransferase